MECYDRGIISLEDTKEIQLTFENYEAIIQMLGKVAYREGFGNISAEGVKRPSEIIGKMPEVLRFMLKGWSRQATSEGIERCRFGLCCFVQGSTSPATHGS